jgi:hypothetical protein
MHARPEIREILIEQKLRRWLLVAKFPEAYPRCSPARARKNYWRLLRAYPSIGARLKLSATSVYAP